MKHNKGRYSQVRDRVGDDAQSFLVSKDQIINLTKELNEEELSTKVLDSKGYVHKLNFLASIVQRDLLKIANAVSGQSSYTCGYIYAISNPAWPGFIKIGKSVDVFDRLNNYQTSSPLRDYTLIGYAFVLDRHAQEKELLSKFNSTNEWVSESTDNIRLALNSINIFK